MRSWKPGLIILACMLVIGCASTFLKVENPEDLNADKDFTKAVQIVVPEEESPSMAEKPEVAAVNQSSEAQSSGTSKKTEIISPKSAPSKAVPVKKVGASKSTVSKSPVIPARRQPDLEDDQGFLGRRPLKDPFWVGETVVHDVHYFKISAGTLTLKVDPFAQVNGAKAYTLVTHIKTYDNFSRFVHAVDDKVVALLDFEELIPRVYTLHVKETNQAREVRSFFDFEKLQANVWEKKVTKKNGAEEKTMKWEILPYSQNVFSAAFYMRLFKWEDGREYAFRVADDKENLVFKGKVLRREVLETQIGPMKAIVIKPEITLKGNFKPIGDILMWLSDDERKHILRIESKIKIGTLVSEVIEIRPGKAP